MKTALADTLGAGRMQETAQREPPMRKRHPGRSLLESGLTCRQVQIMSKHTDPKTVIRYDRVRKNLEQDAVNFLLYEEGLWS